MAACDPVAAHLLRQTCTMDADDDLLDVNCGRCGKRLRIRFDELQDLRTIDCDDCKKLPPREPPTSDGCDGMARHVASVRPGLRTTRIAPAGSENRTHRSSREVTTHNMSW